MSENYIGVPYLNRISPAFQKEDFLGSGLSTITVGSVSHTNAYELSVDVLNFEWRKSYGCLG